ncbi:hypothetical protein K7X08_013745 [Anisodus acutangulus]|uniref:Uncharacterized protein n=1 Tax=Anisodus acutangulus TaxID=402998 RepID=A0A9Q1LM53_9SOLA|nr:hypothetical protein K7X08_013745 [Anisodus acutangulus]
MFLVLTIVPLVVEESGRHMVPSPIIDKVQHSTDEVQHDVGVDHIAQHGIADDFANPADVQDHSDEDPSDEDVVFLDGNDDVVVDIAMGLNEVPVQLE